MVTAKPDPFEAVAVDFICPNIGLGIEAVGHDPCPSYAGHGPNQRVVAVQDGNATFFRGGQGARKLGFGLRNLLDGAQTLQVDRPHIGDDSDSRPGPGAQVRDLPQRVHAHLEYCPLIFAAEPQQRQRETNFVIKIAFAANRRVADRQDVRDGFFRSSLANAAGDADCCDGKLRAPMCCSALQPSPAVRYDKDQRQSRVSRIGLCLAAPKLQASVRPEDRTGFAVLQRSLFCDGGDGSGSKCCVQIQVSISPVARKRYKQAARGHGSRIHDGVHDHAASQGGRQSRFAQRLSDVV